ncbi:MAG: hypothetical protein HY675_14760 [Chloroflexi bacterium]|nr:hypothetical protein [Chloroflexota bacterium]
MALRARGVSPVEVKIIRPSFAGWASRAWRPALVILLGIGIWIVLRWAGSLSPRPEPSLWAFWADGGGEVIEVRGIYAPQEYFRLSQRDPATLGMDPAQELIFFLLIDTHEHDENLPYPDTWWDEVSLRVDGGQGYRPVQKKFVLDSGHHQTVAFAFRRSSVPEFRENKGMLTLDVPSVSGDGARKLQWWLPLEVPAAPSPLAGFVPPFLAALLPLLAGLLVAFSPCVVHMSSYYFPLFGGMAAQGPGGARTRGEMAMASILFTLGFSVPYTVAGVAVGFAGQFVRGSSFLAALTQPMTFVAGMVVLFLGLQVAGVLRLPTLMRLNPLRLRFGPSRLGYLASGFLGLNLAVGCLGCVGGSLFAALLIYGGAVGSPLEAGVVLFLFAVAANAPFFLAAMTLGRLQLRRRLPFSMTRYVPVVSGAILIALSLLILSGAESLMEDTLIRALGLEVRG